MLMSEARSVCLLVCVTLAGCPTPTRSGRPFDGIAETGGASETAAPGDADSSTPSGTTANDPTTSSSSAPLDDSGTSSAATDGPDPSTTGPNGSTDTGTRPTLCDQAAGTALVPPVVCDGPNGNTTTEIPPNALYSTSWFGCYFDEGGEIVEDPFDNCEFACGNQGLCPAGQSGPECEANLRWFAANVDRYGCGGRIRVTNCANGNAVILTTLDRGPNCNSVEQECGTPVLDMSHDAMVFLFDGGIYGGCDHETVVVEPVPEDTPLGPE